MLSLTSFLDWRDTKKEKALCSPNTTLLSFHLAWPVDQVSRLRPLCPQNEDQHQTTTFRVSRCEMARCHFVCHSLPFMIAARRLVVKRPNCYYAVQRRRSCLPLLHVHALMYDVRASATSITWVDDMAGIDGRHHRNKQLGAASGQSKMSVVCDCWTWDHGSIGIYVGVSMPLRAFGPFQPRRR